MVILTSERAEEIVSYLSIPGQIERGILEISRACVHHAVSCPENQNRLAEQGALPLLISLSCPSNPPRLRTYALGGLSQMCAWNKPNSLRVGNDRAFYETIETSFTSRHTSPDLQPPSSPLSYTAPDPDPISTRDLQLSCMNALYNVLNNSFDSHPHLIPLVTHLLPLLVQPELSSGTVAAWSCNVIYNFTLCTESRAPLVALGVCAPLESVSRLSLPEGWCSVVVTMALANLGSKNIPVEAVRGVYACFVASMHGHPYTADSEVYFDTWEVAMAIANMAGSSHACREELWGMGMADTLQSALEECSGSGCEEEVLLVKYALQALWNLSAP